MTVKRLRDGYSLKPKTPPCSADVGPQGWHPAFAAKRMEAATAKGLRPMQCTRSSVVEIDGKPYCTGHAGPILIEQALK